VYDWWFDTVLNGFDKYKKYEKSDEKGVTDRFFAMLDTGSDDRFLYPSYLRY
jgi:hypothetical protein